MKICKNCGNECDDNIKFCDKCAYCFPDIVSESVPVQNKKSIAGISKFASSFIYPVRILFIAAAVVLCYISLTTCTSQTYTRINSIPATYEEIEHDIEFIAYDSRGVPGSHSYTDVIMILEWFSDTVFTTGSGEGSGYSSNEYFMFFDENMEMGFIQIHSDSITPPKMSDYSQVLSDSSLTGEIIIPSERVYGVTTRMISKDQRMEQTTHARYDSEKRQEIEDIYELLDDRLVLMLDNNTTWVERIEITPYVPVQLIPVIETHYLRSTIVMALALLLLLIPLFSISAYNSKNSTPK
jgi:hypothetical protein